MTALNKLRKTGAALALAGAALSTPVLADSALDRLVQVQHSEGTRRGPHCEPDKPADPAAETRSWDTDRYMMRVQGCNDIEIDVQSEGNPDLVDVAWRRPMNLQIDGKIVGNDLLVLERNDENSFLASSSADEHYIEAAVTTQPQVLAAGRLPRTWHKINNIKEGSLPAGVLSLGDYRFQLSARAGLAGKGQRIAVAGLDDLSGLVLTNRDGVNDQLFVRLIDNCGSATAPAYGLEIVGLPNRAVTLVLQDLATGTLYKFPVKKGLRVDATYSAVAASCGVVPAHQLPQNAPLTASAIKLSDLGMSLADICDCPADDAQCEADKRFVYDNVLGIGQNAAVLVQPYNCTTFGRAGTNPASHVLSHRAFLITGYLGQSDGSACGTNNGQPRLAGHAVIDVGQGDLMPLDVLAEATEGSMEVGLGGYDRTTSKPHGSTVKVGFGYADAQNSALVYRPTIEAIAACTHPDIIGRSCK